MANSLSYKWTIFCETEAKNIIIEQKPRPLTCPNGNDHTIDHSRSDYELYSLPPMPTDKTKNIGYYISEGINMDCDPLTTSIKTVVFPYDITLCSAMVQAIPENNGDELSIILSPDAVIGANTAPITIGDTFFYISNPSIEYCIKGAFLNFEGEIVRIKTLDLINAKITVCSPFVSNHNPGTYISRNVYIAKDIFLHEGCISLGKSNPYPSYIEAGVSFNILYKNNQNVQKKFNMIIDYY